MMVILTCLMTVLICGLPTLADGPVTVAFGDSITFGANLKPEESYPAQLQTLLRAQPGWETTTVVNAGIGGNTVAQGLARLEKDVLSHQPGAVLIGFGMNDSVMTGPGQARVPVAQFAETLTEMVRRVRESGARALLATVTPVVEEYYFERHPKEWYPEGLGPQLALYTAAIRAVAEATGARLVDLNALDPAQHLRTPANSGSRDGVHPTPAGCAVMAKQYAAALCDSELAR